MVWKIHYEWRFLARTITHSYDPFSSEPCWMKPEGISENHQKITRKSHQHPIKIPSKSLQNPIKIMYPLFPLRSPRRVWKMPGSPRPCPRRWPFVPRCCRRMGTRRRARSPGHTSSSLEKDRRNFGGDDFKMIQPWWRIMINCISYTEYIYIYVYIYIHMCI